MNNHQIICVEDKTLNAVTVDALFAKIDTLLKEISTNECKGIEIDLQKVEFIDPYGLVCLCLIGRHLKENFKTVILVLPDDEKFQSYLCTMNFPCFAREFMHFKNDDYFTEELASTDSEALLELTKIETKGTVKNKMKEL